MPPAHGPLVVAPLFDATGVVKGAALPRPRSGDPLNESTVTLFLGIAEWVSAALSRLARDEQTERRPRSRSPQS